MGRIKKKEKGKGLGYYLRNFNKKHRVSIREQHSDTELSYMYISSLRIVLSVLGVLIIMFAVVIFAVVRTPILDNLPVTPGRQTRARLTESIMRLDSLQNEMNIALQYGENVALVMEGKTPVVRTMNRHTDGFGEEKELVAANEADSLLRAQIEAADGRYALEVDAGTTPGQNGARRMEFTPPVRGEVSQPFNPATGMYGVRIGMNESQQVVSAADGTVILSLWTPEDNYVIQIQHKENYITIYKNAAQLLKSVGETVEGGEVIAYVERGGSDPGAGGGLTFELWNEGRPVDPQRYIYF